MCRWTIRTYFSEQRPSSEANRFLPSQEITRILWNPKVHYRVYKSQPPVRIMSLIDAIMPPIPVPGDPS
jgi:hypothetical protein